MSDASVRKVIFKPITQREKYLTNGASSSVKVGKLGAKKRQAESYGVVSAKSEG